MEQGTGFYYWSILYVTTSETKIGFLLIAIFERQFKPQKDGHLMTGGHLLYISKQAFSQISYILMLK